MRSFKVQPLSNNFEAMRSLLAIALPIVVATCATTIAISSCNGGEDNGNHPPDTIISIHVDVPNFLSDSAFSYVRKQVEFGPRVPGSSEHRACGDWLEQQLRFYTANSVIIQRQPAKLFTGKTI